jgi:hypothetical protein
MEVIYRQQTKGSQQKGRSIIYNLAIRLERKKLSNHQIPYTSQFIIINSMFNQYVGFMVKVLKCHFCKFADNKLQNESMLYTPN